MYIEEIQENPHVSNLLKVHNEILHAKYLSSGLYSLKCFSYIGLFDFDQKTKGSNMNLLCKRPLDNVSC
jgi:hypothetical protein